jgi:hypothetical protein
MLLDFIRSIDNPAADDSGVNDNLCSLLAKGGQRGSFMNHRNNIRRESDKKEVTQNSNSN